MVQEQALLGLDLLGDAAAAQLIFVEGNEPQLSLMILDHAGGPSRVVAQAPGPVARAVSVLLCAQGHREVPLLALLVEREWPQP